MKKLKTATVTWITWDNYGSYLQAYALQQTLMSLGCCNRILSDEYYVQKQLTLFQRVIIILGLLRHRKERKSKFLFKLFKWRYLKLDNGHDCKKQDRMYDLFICGSDQIWSPYLKYEPYYYLHHFSKPKIAYAPSTGTAHFSSEYINNVLPELRRFAALSLREECAARALSEQTSLPIVSVADPTILLSATQWRKLAASAKPREKYILCYYLTPNTWYMDWVKKYAERHGYSIRIFDNYVEYKQYGENVSAGPREFVGLIDAAEMVFTDSYHASIFSILLHKRFITFKRFEDKGEKDQNERIYCLFEKLSLQAYFIGKDSLSTIETLPEVDYSQVEPLLSEWRLDSLNYLKKAIRIK